MKLKYILNTVIAATIYIIGMEIGTEFTGYLLLMMGVILINFISEVFTDE